ncbi:putative type IV restriction endonuclease [Parabacteroides sp. PF5-5]|uniref:type I restriction enzyme HsdR N-terminal domain-containing protein n=1 Tax=unclassified Parabacteroides TaxID=2649774 RepID=UPI002473AB9E|nr:MULTISPECIES: type I restriction enzyme HsdR N-terminal domain-containing protein [unclassified Parabacteroides]MDH6303804.1 putative type IV restriction endonuclease [Parabacteroides sp. PH5-39]MDH6314421.1 putative type IV restriction endonuclease [Parabacteroides sp. PF5-13]MDH6318514.1 putative type IV restriction endonuclease [Parabacteroides sp. PH5-13]MDH6322193.1 putative type IV restriction endonuclease [Parabacteroides sp. PH5-8]MDH6325727.1 putative type IV restriction endonuclea
MLSLNLPGFDAKVTQKDGKPFIFDSLRRKYVALTPEEWVRQHFINYLVAEKKYPKELLANEITIKLNGTTKRCDTIVYNRFLAPIMIIEYKAPSVPVKRAVFDQIARYNASLRVRYLIVSNGMQHFCCRIDYDTQTYTFLESLPAYDELGE